MKILHLSKFYPPDPGGLEHVVACLAEGAAVRGHEVRVVCATGYSRIRLRGRRITEPPRSGVVVVRLPTRGIIWSQPIAPAYLPAARWPADVVHLHHPHPLADLAALTRVRAPLIVTQHSDVRRQALARPLYWPLVRAVLRRARFIVVPTRAHLQVSRELAGFESKIRVVPFGVDEARFVPPPHPAPPQPPTFPAERPLGLFVGRLVGYKGLDVLLDALDGTALSFVVVGDGPLKDWVEQEVARRGMAGRVRVAGEVPADELVRCYQAADYLVLPSTTPAEMFGIVLIEAMACGRPVITTRLATGVRLVNEAGVTGLEVPAGDVLALRAAMEQLAGDVELRRRMGLAGRRRVEERFTLGRMIEDHLAVYREAAGSS